MKIVIKYRRLRIMCKLLMIRVINTIYENQSFNYCVRVNNIKNNNNEEDRKQLV